MSFEQPIFVLYHIAAFSFFASLAISGFMVHTGPLDKPVSRSSHKDIIPTSAGLGLIAGLGAGLLAWCLYYPNFGNMDLPKNLIGKMASLILLSVFWV